VKWLADECLDNDVVRGLFRRSPDLDLVRAQDIPEISGHDDEALLAWAAKQERVVLTHDLATMVPALPLRGQPASTAIVIVPDSLPIGQVIEEVLLLDQASVESDWAAGVIYLPLR
jgi:predicted nuclease of predicted toxin-antitoxin system